MNWQHFSTDTIQISSWLKCFKSTRKHVHGDMLIDGHERGQNKDLCVAIRTSVWTVYTGPLHWRVREVAEKARRYIVSTQINVTSTKMRPNIYLTVTTSSFSSYE
jgi:hypothetical protein